MDLNNLDEKLLEQNIEKFKSLTPDEIENLMHIRQREEHPINNDKLDKLIDCAHEIVFSISAHVLDQNEKGELTGSRELCIKNYHIPVPIDKDYNNYMKTFFNYLEERILQTIKDTNNTSKDKEESK